MTTEKMTAEEFNDWWFRRRASEYTQEQVATWLKYCSDNNWTNIYNIPADRREEYVAMFMLIFG